MTNLVLVLVEPEKPWNIGSTARLMNNFAVKELRLVTQFNNIHHHEKARVLAVNSRHLLEQAKIYHTLPEALADCDMSVATTARERSIVETHSSWQLPSLFSAGLPARLAFVFGRETSGLENDELAFCTHAVHIPTFGESGSFNLSKAVAIILYEFSKVYFQHQEERIPPVARATAETLESLKDHLQRTLDQAGFALNYDASYVRRSLSKLVGQANLSNRDVRLLHKMLRAFEEA